MTDNQSTNKKKRLLVRSTRYPYYSIKDCINFAEMVKTIGGRREAPVSSILKEMNVKDVTNKRYSYSVSSSEQFGLIERTEGGLKVTDKVMSILFPTGGEEQKKEILKECVKKPNLYNHIISQYDGLHLPEKDILKNNFLHYGIAEKVVNQAVDSFLESMKYAGLIYEGKLAVTVPTEQDNPPNEESENKPSKESEEQKNDTPQISSGSNEDEYHKFELLMSSGKKALIHIPVDCTEKDLNKLKALLEVICGE